MVHNVVQPCTYGPSKQCGLRASRVLALRSNTPITPLACDILLEVRPSEAHIPTGDRARALRNDLGDQLVHAAEGGGPGNACQDPMQPTHERIRAKTIGSLKAHDTGASAISLLTNPSASNKSFCKMYTAWVVSVHKLSRGGLSRKSYRAT